MLVRVINYTLIQPLNKELRVIVATKNNNLKYLIFSLVSAIVVAGAAYFAASSLTTKAAPVPEDCFVFNSGTGMITGYNPDTDALCVSDIDIPQTIGGVTVTGIAEDSFVDDVVTSVNFPETITLIENNAFTGDDVTLSSIDIEVASNLIIEPNAFNGIIGSSISISAGGDLDVGGNFYGSTLVSLAMQAGNDININGGGGISGSDMGSLSVVAGDSIFLNNGSFSSNSADILTIAATGGDVTISGGSFTSSGVGTMVVSASDNVLIDASFYGSGSEFDSITINATGGDVDITNGSFGINDIGSVDIFSGGNITFTNGAFYNNVGLQTLSAEASGGINVINNVLGNMPTLATASFTTGSDLLSITGGSFGNNPNLETINIYAPAGVVISGGSMGSLPSLKNLNFLASTGDVTIINGALGNSGLTSLEIDTAGSIAINQGGLGSSTGLEHLSLVAGTDLILGSGAASGDLPELVSLILGAGNDAAVEGTGTFSNAPKLNNLSINAGNSLVIGANTFNAIGVEHVTLPSSLVSIGEKAFYGSSLKAVYLNSTPTLGDYAFGLAGAAYDGSAYGYTQLDQVRYVPIYVSVPHSYTDTAYAPDDVDGDSVDDATGGYIINPAQVTVNYLNDDGDALNAPMSLLGQLPNGDQLTDYLVSSNPTGDFSLYFHAGDQYTPPAPAAISPFVTPAAQTLTLGSGLNNIELIYTTPGVPNTSKATNSRLSPLLVVFIIGGAVVGMGVGIITKHLVAQRLRQ